MLINWIKKNQLEFIALLVILVVSSFFRFYDISGYMTFLGDEGRDAIIVKRLLTEGDLPFIGPPTSVGNIYLGPLYYYMMAFPMAISGLNPTSAAYMVAVIGVLVVFLIYYLNRKWFGKLPAVAASFLYAISPVTIIYSKSSWNPNPAPFFALLAILGFYKLHRKGNFLWLILTGATVAAAIQMHYLALILIPTVGILWLYEFSLNFRNKLKRNHVWVGTIGGIVAFWVVMSPLVLFDLNPNHRLMNYYAITTLFSSSNTVGLDPLNLISKAVNIFKDNLIGHYMVGGQPVLSGMVSLLIIFPLIFAFYQKLKGQVLRWPYLALTVYLIVGIFGLSLYKQEIYDHYLGFLNPAPYLLLGASISMILYRILFVKVLMWVVIIILIIVNLQKNPLQYPSNNQLQRTQEIARFVIVESGNKPFNFALLSENNYDSAYQYYLDLYEHKPSQVPFNITSQLFVVCEDSVCQPIGHPKHEIAGFGMAKIEIISQINGVKVYKLIANPTGEPPK